MDSILGQSMRNLWCKSVNGTNLSPNISICLLRCSILIHLLSSFTIQSAIDLHTRAAKAGSCLDRDL
jgi:hypothetical protein